MLYEHPTSSEALASTAVGLAARIFPTIGELRVLFIGDGSLHGDFMSALSAAGARVTVENRPDLIPDRLAAHDIVVVKDCPSLEIRKADLERAFRARRRRPIVIAELSQPTVVEPEAASLEDLFLYAFGDLRALTRAA